MSRTTWRVLRTETTRGAAWLPGLAIAAVVAISLWIRASGWAGRWVSLTEDLSFFLLWAVPLAATAGAWWATRERRRKTTELVRATSRLRPHRAVMVWAALSLSASAGLLLAWLSGAAAVAPIATHPGRGWWWTLVVALVSVAAGSAVGLAVGRVVPGRIVRYRCTHPVTRSSRAAPAWYPLVGYRSATSPTLKPAFRSSSCCGWPRSL